ncbi:MAG: dephospho-CoA kinase, CoaE, nonfunctional [Candidatus Moranbacteria bacterium GW2011_GWC2_37_8]|nr:MAG: dephospho-CoA kinase, CoaE, nonfunctional [Candidatus Moranbacteria bacterium GW2011_GWC2_37_8]KKQ63366.1 MAG: dephospho-CoA kinase, CoaE, nonfunctional [Parcubacteria group bacterium GW2011_GWC1_38_22]KKQ80959.1 MAG: dephospho-CoA kinase, CoaE, nonfunctional [Candidatus Moranbacteria bacterium GW2011_GWD2_38_7]
MAKLILGIAGEMGSGKEAVSTYLCEKYGASSRNFSQILKDILERLYLPIMRENFAPLSLALRKTFGEDILAKVMFHDAVDDENDVIVVQGIRRRQDMVFLRELPNFKFIYVDADIETRFERVKNRKEKENDALITFEQFKASHEYETEKTILGLKDDADYMIQNNGTYEELYSQIDKIISNHI